MGAARLRVSTELLREVLHLPIGTDITCAGTVVGFDQIELTVTHPDLQDMPAREGTLPPLICPTFRRQEPIVFEGWNQTRE